MGEKENGEEKDWGSPKGEAGCGRKGVGLGVAGRNRGEGDKDPYAQMS